MGRTQSKATKKINQKNYFVNKMIKYKIQKYKLQDKIELRESIIKKAGNEVLKLSANKDKKTLYNFMLEYNLIIISPWFKMK